MTDKVDFIAAERERVLAEYQRRGRENKQRLYEPWEPAELFMRGGRERAAAALLHRAGIFPREDSECLEVGFGTIGWLGTLITWGCRETNLHGIELDAARAARARARLTEADLRVGDATALPWPDNTFNLVIASTLFSSILDEQVRRLIADEITRVMAPGGGLLWYDFAVNNPHNAGVRKVTRRELRRLFPSLEGAVKSVTLAPPLARRLVHRSWALATALEILPFARTHLLAALVKSS